MTPLDRGRATGISRSLVKDPSARQIAIQTPLAYSSLDHLSLEGVTSMLPLWQAARKMPHVVLAALREDLSLFL